MITTTGFLVSDRLPHVFLIGIKQPMGNQKRAPLRCRQIRAGDSSLAWNVADGHPSLNRLRIEQENV